MYLTQSLHRAVQQRPDSTLTVFGARQRTSREVEDRVSRLAGALRSRLSGPGARVAILAANSDRYFETLLACWWTGAVASPVNIRWSAAEITYALTDSGAEIVIVDDLFAGAAGELGAACPQPITFVYAGDGVAPADMADYETLVEASEPVADCRLGDETPAALLYTGGTTGRAKGVVCTHRSLLSSGLGTQAVARAVRPGGTALITGPLFHIAALGACLRQYYVGGSCVFLPSFTPETVLQAIDRHSITSIALVPVMLQSVVDHARRGEFALATVRSVEYGGAPIDPGVLERAIAAFPDAGFHQGYGMTETAMITQLGPDDHTPGSSRLRSVGRATPHCDVRIVDEEGAEVPRGEVGEILARSDAVSPGYWNKPEETAAAMRDGWMHTGDAGYMDAEGYVYIVDRLKDMIVSGAENVYSREVELALATHPATEAAAVIGLPDETWGERVHAVIVLNPGTTTSLEEIRSHCKTLIAGYKCPRSVDFVEALPLSAAGKVLKRQLRAEALGRIESGLVQPGGPDPRVLARNPHLRPELHHLPRNPHLKDPT